MKMCDRINGWDERDYRLWSAIRVLSIRCQ
jgi:hypothetical protein